MSLASRVRQRRIALKMTQSHLATLTGVSQQAINRIESGIIARPRYLVEMAQALNCDVVWLVNGDPQESNENEKA